MVSQKQSWLGPRSILLGFHHCRSLPTPGVHYHETGVRALVRRPLRPHPKKNSRPPSGLTRSSGGRGGRWGLPLSSAVFPNTVPWSGPKHTRATIGSVRARRPQPGTAWRRSAGRRGPAASAPAAPRRPAPTHGQLVTRSSLLCCSMAVQGAQQTLVNDPGRAGPFIESHFHPRRQRERSAVGRVCPADRGEPSGRPAAGRRLTLSPTASDRRSAHPIRSPSPARSRFPFKVSGLGRLRSACACSRVSRNW